MQIRGISPDVITYCGQISLGDSDFGLQREISPMDLDQVLGQDYMHFASLKKSE